MKKMQQTYGADKGKSVFYASANAKKITGVHEAARDMSRQACLRRFARHMRRQASRIQ
jgi:hypothetical protein